MCFRQACAIKELDLIREISASPGRSLILRRMPEFSRIFGALKPVMAEQEGRLAVQKDTPYEYSLVTMGPSPFPQHKGRPMWFGAVKLGKAYVSFHLMPLYMSPTLEKEISPALKKRMQGKSCFNFKAVPDEKLLMDLKNLTEACARAWDKQFHLFG
jgi:hypothetical protein